MRIAAFPVLWEFGVVTRRDIRGSTMYLLKEILGRQLDVAIRARRVKEWIRFTDRRQNKGSVIVGQTHVRNRAWPLVQVDVT